MKAMLMLSAVSVLLGCGSSNHSDLNGQSKPEKTNLIKNNSTLSDAEKREMIIGFYTNFQNLKGLEMGKIYHEKATFKDPVFNLESGKDSPRINLD